MTYWKAMTYAITGKGVRRQSKPDDIYFMNGPIMFHFNGNTCKIVKSLEEEDILAEDWELSYQYNRENMYH